MLYYFTWETESKINGEAAPRYGVGIDMYTQLPNERTLRERKIAEDIFANKREAEFFVNMLCKGTVTPATLNDIIDDYVIA